MKKLNFSTIAEFEHSFPRTSRKFTDAVVAGIEKALMENKKSAGIFTISFETYDGEFDISLPQSQWSASLDACLKHYSELNLTDECIDTWKLLELTKTL